MGVNAVGVGYPAWYNAGRAGTDNKAGKTSGNTSQPGFVDKAYRIKEAAGTSQPLVLHGKNDADEGETVVGSSVNALAGVSMAVYKPQNFDAANPIYHVKTWDADGAGKSFDTETDGRTKKTARQYREQVFNQIAPNAPQRVKQAWMDAADVAGIDGMGISDSGKLSHISQLMVRSIEKGYRSGGVCDLLGNSVQSAMRAAKEALYALEHPLDGNRGRTAEQIENRMKEKLFYQEFLKRL